MRVKIKKIFPSSISNIYSRPVAFKAADFQMLRKVKNEEKKITLNTGQVMFSGEIYYYRPLNSSEKVGKIVGKTLFFFA